MSHHPNEFDWCEPNPRKGLTSVEAEQLLRHAFPDVTQWLLWEPEGRRNTEGLSRIPVGTEDGGRVRGWSWKIAAVEYPRVCYCMEDRPPRPPAHSWTGAIRVEGPASRAFLLFSFLSSRGSVGQFYMASTQDISVLNAFAEDALAEYANSKFTLRVHSVNGEDMWLDADKDDHILLPDGLRKDIESQVDIFFERPDLFDAYGLPRRRGFLFVGSPGNGKTLLTRHLLRRCWRKFGVHATTLVPSRDTDERDLSRAFQTASKEGPGILVLEDLDSLTKECKLTRAAFLAMLDGLHPKECVLVLGSTNNPGDIDPALAHRPSRFDRVWHFENPERDLRRQYLRRSFDIVSKDLIEQLAQDTDGWSFAYLNELRMTTAMLSIADKTDPRQEDCLLKAHTMLAEQFRAGKKNHAEPGNKGNLGFKAA
jgi:hypothetical protein